jgi:hypothetical protein
MTARGRMIYENKRIRVSRICSLDSSESHCTGPCALLLLGTIQKRWVEAVIYRLLLYILNLQTSETAQTFQSGLLDLGISNSGAWLDALEPCVLNSSKREAVGEAGEILCTQGYRNQLQALRPVPVRFPLSYNLPVCLCINEETLQILLGCNPCI